MNIRHVAGQQFVGELAPDPDGFCTFNFAENGIRAGGEILLTYYKSDRINTIQGAITRWSATDQASYIAYVAERVGVFADTILDFYYPVTLFKLVSAMIWFENGINPYNTMQIKVALAQAVAGTP